MTQKKILVVDDEIDFLELIKIRLEANDYHVITACTGKEALGKIKSDKPDAVLLDIQMAELDGLKVLEMIRKRDADLPVYIVTAFSGDERFERAKALGASGFIVKTSDLNKEIKNITSALSVANKYRKA